MITDQRTFISGQHRRPGGAAAGADGDSEPRAGLPLAVAAVAPLLGVALPRALLAAARHRLLRPHARRQRVPPQQRQGFLQESQPGVRGMSIHFIDLILFLGDNTDGFNMT